MTDKIGVPLDVDETVQGGVLGPRKTITSKQTPQPVTKLKDEQVDKEPERIKRTILFRPAQAKWLKVQAAQEGREMSEIVAEALEMYKKLHTPVQ